MTSQTGLPARHFNAYHQNDSLLFQFILSEFLEAFREIQMIVLKQYAIEELTTGLKKLAGSPHEYMRLFPWNHNNGILAKLKNYCSLFSQNTYSKEKESIALQHYAEKAWVFCLETLDILYESTDGSTAHVNPLNKAYNALQRISRVIARLLVQFRDDENVVFFVLRHHDQFDGLYGTKFVSRLFCRMYPKGLAETAHFLSTKFGTRGFENILPIVKTKISELETAV